MARMSHDLADARYAFRMHVNLYFGRVERRIKQTGEDFIMEKYNEVTARGGVWDHTEIAKAAWEYSQSVISGEIEAGADDVSEAA